MYTYICIYVYMYVCYVCYVCVYCMVWYGPARVRQVGGQHWRRSVFQQYGMVWYGMVWYGMDVWMYVCVYVCLRLSMSVYVCIYIYIYI